MLYRMRQAGGDGVAVLRRHVRAGQRARRARRVEDVTLERAEDAWTSPALEGASTPPSGRSRSASLGLDVTITPLLADQELVTSTSTGVTYWEGACRVDGKRAARPIGGRAYVEMTGYAGRDVPAFAPVRADRRRLATYLRRLRSGPAEPAFDSTSIVIVKLFGLRESFVKTNGNRIARARAFPRRPSRARRSRASGDDVAAPRRGRPRPRRRGREIRPSLSTRTTASFLERRLRLALLARRLWKTTCWILTSSSDEAGCSGFRRPACSRTVFVNSSADPTAEHAKHAAANEATRARRMGPSCSKGRYQRRAGNLRPCLLPPAPAPASAKAPVSESGAARTPRSPSPSCPSSWSGRGRRRGLPSFPWVSIVTTNVAAWASRRYTYGKSIVVVGAVAPC